MNKPSRILLITRNLPPLVGGMERLNWHMADELSKFAEVKVIGPTGSASLKPEQVSLSEAPLRPLPLFLLVALLKTAWLAIRWKPDLIIAGSGLAAPIAWLSSKFCRARSAAYLHGLDITVKDKLYQLAWIPTLRKIDHIIVNSTPTKALALTSGIREQRISIVYPGVSLPEVPQPAENIKAFKEKHGLTGKKILLSVGRLTTRKGLAEFVERALPSIVQAEPKTVLAVIGEEPKDSLAAGIQTIANIKAQAERSGVSGNVKFLGVITDRQLLATAYEAADVHIFPVRHLPHDPEGFGMVAIEAAAHGLPTVTFATGGIVDAVKEGVSGYLVEKNDYQQISKKILHCLNRRPESPAIKMFAETFSWPAFGQRLIDTLQAEAL